MRWLLFCNNLTARRRVDKEWFICIIVRHIEILIATETQRSTTLNRRWTMKKWTGFIGIMAVAIMVVLAWAPEAKAFDSINLVNELHVGVIGSEMRNAHKASVGVSEKLVYNNTGHVSPILDIGGERTVSNINTTRDVANWMVYATVGAKYQLADSINLYASIGPGITSTNHSDSNGALVGKVSIQYGRFTAGILRADAQDEGNTSLVFAGITF